MVGGPLVASLVVFHNPRQRVTLADDAGHHSHQSSEWGLLLESSPKVLPSRVAGRMARVAGDGSAVSLGSRVWMLVMPRPPLPGYDNLPGHGAAAPPGSNHRHELPGVAPRRKDGNPVGAGHATQGRLAVGVGRELVNAPPLVPLAGGPQGISWRNSATWSRLQPEAAM